jgi:hypothetical protein
MERSRSSRTGTAVLSGLMAAWTVGQSPSAPEVDEDTGDTLVTEEFRDISSPEEESSDVDDTIYLVSDEVILVFTRLEEPEHFIDNFPASGGGMGGDGSGTANFDSMPFRPARKRVATPRIPEEIGLGPDPVKKRKLDTRTVMQAFVEGLNPQRSQGQFPQGWVSKNRTPNAPRRTPFAYHNDAPVKKKRTV